MKTIACVSILALFGAMITACLAEQLREMQYEEVPTRVIPDSGFADKSLLIVESTVPGLMFESTKGIKPGSVREKEPGIWWVTLKPGVQLISIGAEGFLSLKDIRHNFLNRQAWQIRVTPQRPEVNELPVVIRVEPAGSDVLIDGERLDISGSLKLAVGEHRIEISGSGYVAIRDRFTVSEDKILFEYSLEKPRLCVVAVSTDPPGAEVTIDSVKLGGTTPISDFYNSGRYPIRITMEGYLPVEETIYIDPDRERNSFKYRLEFNTGTIVVSSDPEVNLNVSLNDKPVGATPLTLREQDVGEYEVTASHRYYTAEALSFSLKRGETFRVALKAEENFAVLTINTTLGATVYLNDQQLTGLRDVRLSPQTARLRAEKPKSKTAETALILKRGARETVDLFPDEQTGTIAVSVDPPDAQIELTGDAGEHFTSKGTKIFEDIPMGMYELEVSASGHKTDNRSLRLRPDETVRERIILEEGVSGEGPLPGMMFVEIPAGSFMMGSPSNEKDHESDEGPLHRVTIESFRMMTTEVTQGMWQAIMGTNPSHFRGDDLPVEQVSWNDILDFVEKLNKRDPGKGYRLPSESEWEYACRGGTTTRFYSGDGDSDLDRASWYSGNSGGGTHPVGQKFPNSFGLYDMHGNVWEWCEDWYHDSYTGAPLDGGAWVSPSSSARVYRGGGWNYRAGHCRSAFRNINSPSIRHGNLGFRLARSYD